MKTTLLTILVIYIFNLGLSNKVASTTKERISHDILSAGNKEPQRLTSRKLTPDKSCFTFDGKVICLNNGISEKKADVNSAGKIITRYTGTNSTGDLNGDGKNDMIVILTQETGGSGTFYYAAVISSENNKYRGSNAVFLGDRIKIKRIEIDKGVAVISYLGHPKNESMASNPTKEFSMKLQFKSGVLSAEPENDSYAGKKWKWDKTVLNNDKIIVPKQKEAFTVIFTDDGKISITTDCNLYSGNCKVEKGKLLLGPLMSTRKYCEGSQEEVFIKFIGEVDSIFIDENNKLILQLKSDGGSMIFN